MNKLIILPKKQLIAVLLGTMLVVVGALNYKNPTVEVSGNITENLGETEFVVNMKEDVEKIDTANSSISDEYFVTAHHEKEDTYNKQIKYHEDILYSEKSDDDAKKLAQERINSIIDKISKEMAIEKILMAKGFSDVLTIINDDNVNVIIKTVEELNISEVAQVQSVIMREAKVNPEDVHIITKK